MSNRLRATWCQQKSSKIVLLRNMPIRETPNAHWNDRIFSIQAR
jgi:hypothetical protein